MIVETEGDLLAADCDALVNAVNCVGVMGKGIALAFKRAYPSVFTEYKRACDRGLVTPGAMFTVATGEVKPQWIVHFPTKEHWRDESKIEHVERGLLALAREVRARSIESIAVPALGCGAGGLAWSDVRPKIVAALEELASTRVLLYRPRV